MLDNLMVCCCRHRRQGTDDDNDDNTIHPGITFWGRTKRFFSRFFSRRRSSSSSTTTTTKISDHNAGPILADLKRLLLIPEKQRPENNVTTPQPPPIAEAVFRLNRRPPTISRKKKKKNDSDDDDVDKIIHALQDLESSLASLSDAITSQQLDGTFTIAINPSATLQDIRMDLFPLRLYNLSVCVCDGDFELVRLRGDLEVNLETRHVDFAFDEMMVLKRPARLPKKKRLVTDSGKAADDGLFSKSIRTSNTSEPMEYVLSLFDDWYLAVNKQTSSKAEQ